MSEYPKREPFYAHKLTRLLFKSCAAQHIGQDAVLLVIHIAHTEDAARYQGPVWFWNSQLNETLGFRSPKTLNNARARAVEAGWLVYTRKNDRSNGLYFTTIPKRVSLFNDEPIEPVPSTESFPSTESISIPSTEREAEQESYALRNGKVTGIDPPPNPSPNPDPLPNPKKRTLALSSDSLLDELNEWVQWWNGMHARGLVATGTRPSDANARALRKAKSDTNVAQMLSDRSKLEAEISTSPFVRGGWFTLAKLLFGKNKESEFIVRQLLDGVYRDAKAKPKYESANFSGKVVTNGF